jgi:hypothetical protein
MVEAITGFLQGIGSQLDSAVVEPISQKVGQPLD